MSDKKTLEDAIRVSVGKDANERLRAEILAGQNVLDKAQLESLPRDRLVEYACQLRSLSNQTESVKSFVEGFNSKKIKWDGGKGGAAEGGAAEGGAQLEAGTLGATEMAS